MHYDDIFRIDVVENVIFYSDGHSLKVTPACIRELMLHLRHGDFYRINRNTILNLRYVTEFDGNTLYTGNPLNGTPFVISREYRALEEQFCYIGSIRLRKIANISHYLFIYDGKRYHVHHVSEIISAKSARAYTRIILRDGKEYLLSYSLGRITLYLPSEWFVRVNRRTTINVMHVTLCRRTFLIAGNERIPVGKGKRAEILSAMKNAGLI
ncbi:MAG: LytTR family transcriptional regulator DNA-binding domain-containing protein [Bacteroidales bacterium]|jgi:DNA-binding LytR/AlgR family response regulator|nr:LytTR family transcriptional regulator DNA-binding domain-containing protein [Bacteroidales bacterium]MCI2122285.1 LytTR family transcriptional regulator DNA-binding domain-containing protein [Bacteroidales bacterium]MCI2145754.1 LytTR family transcriptional regulator DNA-binding domain-containing protein [Bacteroidales bacterium]